MFLAEHIALRRRVALKILHPPPDAEETGNYPQRFKLEAETLATLDHPNIVTLYDYGGAEEGRFYLAMEYIEGPRYTDLLADGTLDAERTIRLLLQVCAALRYAHKRGVIHRDLKPSNLLIRTDAEGMEQLKVVDFGLVKVAEVDQSLTREGLVLGSPHCMAPEQVRGSTEIDHRADIYAIGVLLFRSLTGTYPFHGATSTSTMVAHLSEPIPTFAAVAPALRVHPRLEAIVRRCLAKRPADRYPDVKPLMDDLAACLPGAAEPDTQNLSRNEPTAPAAVPEVAVVPAAAPQKERKALVLLGLVAILAVVTAVYFATRGGDPAPVTTAAPDAPATPLGASAGAAPAGPTPTTPPADAAPAGEATLAGEATPAADVPVADAPAEATPPRAPTADPQPRAPPPRPPPAAPPENGPENGQKPENPEGYMPLPDDFK